MNSTDALAALMALPPDERLMVGQQLTHSALADGAEPDDDTFDDGILSDEVKAELDAIWTGIESGEINTQPWREVMEELKQEELAPKLTTRG